MVINSRHVRAIPWPSGRWRERRRIDTGRAGAGAPGRLNHGRLHHGADRHARCQCGHDGRERARRHAQPRCRGGGGVGWCRRRHRSGGRPLAWRNAHGRGRHPASQRTRAKCASDGLRSGEGGGAADATAPTAPAAAAPDGRWWRGPARKRRAADQPRGPRPRERPLRPPYAGTGVTVASSAPPPSRRGRHACSGRADPPRARRAVSPLGARATAGPGGVVWGRAWRWARAMGWWTRRGGGGGTWAPLAVAWERKA